MSSRIVAIVELGIFTHAIHAKYEGLVSIGDNCFSFHWVGTENLCATSQAEIGRI